MPPETSSESILICTDIKRDIKLVRTCSEIIGFQLYWFPMLSRRGQLGNSDFRGLSLMTPNPVSSLCAVSKTNATN